VSQLPEKVTGAKPAIGLSNYAAIFRTEEFFISGICLCQKGCEIAETVFRFFLSFFLNVRSVTKAAAT
jgi:hypothetical protein